MNARQRKVRLRLPTVLAAMLLFSAILAGPVLKLKDGRELRGTNLAREGDLYKLEIAGGSVIPIPSGAVKEVHWEEGVEPGSGERIVNRVTGRTEEEQRAADARLVARDAEREQTASRERAEAEERAAARQDAARDRQPYEDPSMPRPSAYGGGTVLAGPDVRPPTPAEQLAVFGEPAQFQQDVVSFDLQPSYWVPDPAEANWAPSEFQRPPRDSTWVPTDGFAKSGS